MIKAGIIGGTGYTGVELLRLLIGHPEVELVAISSRSEKGKAVSDIFPSLRGRLDLSFCDPDEAALDQCDVVFAATPNGVAMTHAQSLLDSDTCLIDLSADFRIKDPEIWREWYGMDHACPELIGQAVYGLPEVHRDAIIGSRLVASPGCYPTSISLPLIPLLREKLIDPTSIVTCSMSGVSGAGRNASLPLIFCEANESVRAYSVPKHRHLSEIEQELSKAAGQQVAISFTPHLVPVHNGICSTTSAQLTADPDQVQQALERAYADEFFVRLLGKGGCADTKNVTGTNFIDIGWDYDSRTGRVLLLSAEDNLGKGAAGQAIQNFNLICAFPETAGLQNF